MIISGHFYQSCKIGKENKSWKYCKFEKLCGVVDESDCEIIKILKEAISGHLESLENELHRYFSELKKEESAITHYPFSSSLDVASIPDELQDEFFDLQNDSE